MRLVPAMTMDRWRVATGQGFAGARRKKRERKDALKEQRAKNRGAALELVKRLPIERVLDAELVDDDDSEEDDDSFGAGSRGWGPVAKMGNLRIQAPVGLRAAVVELKPGLYLVAEVPDERVRAEMAGPVASLAKRVVRTARIALEPSDAHRTDRGRSGAPGAVYGAQSSGPSAEAVGCGSYRWER